MKPSDNLIEVERPKSTVVGYVTMFLFTSNLVMLGLAGIFWPQTKAMVDDVALPPWWDLSIFMILVGLPFLSVGLFFQYKAVSGMYQLITYKNKEKNVKYRGVTINAHVTEVLVSDVDLRKGRSQVSLKCQYTDANGKTYCYIREHIPINPIDLNDLIRPDGMIDVQINPANPTIFYIALR